jgi:hypothetical protein
VLRRDNDACVITGAKKGVNRVKLDGAHIYPKSHALKELEAIGFYDNYDIRLGFALRSDLHPDYDKKRWFAIHPKTLHVVLAPSVPKDYPLTRKDKLCFTLDQLNTSSFPTTSVLKLAYSSFIDYWRLKSTYFDSEGNIVKENEEDIDSEEDGEKKPPKKPVAKKAKEGKNDSRVKSNDEKAKKQLAKVSPAKKAEKSKSKKPVTRKRNRKHRDDDENSSDAEGSSDDRDGSHAKGSSDDRDGSDAKGSRDDRDGSDAEGSSDE